ncbi:hypothetical protein [Pontibacter harenae]|uniref:hypothetical protein n=1 Tax=Pontibacter harenae TaxID=2894083 RepID=UPI001E433818|nr:hypothetical protein [Pontibacter harenae]MCC9168531.1 hypothetical protein [Pontibacter harenae]
MINIDIVPFQHLSQTVRSGIVVTGPEHVRFRSTFFAFIQAIAKISTLDSRSSLRKFRPASITARELTN